MATELYFYLDISREQALHYYQGAARMIVVHAFSGQKLQFPAEHIRSFINHSGVQGKFKIAFDYNNRLINLERV